MSNTITLYDWIPFFRGVAQGLAKIGKDAPDTNRRNQHLREIAHQVFGESHLILNSPYIDPFSFIYTLSLVKADTQDDFQYFIKAKAVFNIAINPFPFSDFNYPHGIPQNSLFHAEDGNYVETPGGAAQSQERNQSMLDFIWQVFIKVAEATSSNKENFAQQATHLISNSDFKRLLSIPQVRAPKLTHALFLTNPDIFLPIDDRTLWLPLNFSTTNQDTMSSNFSTNKDTFSKVMHQFTEAFVGCKPYEVNLFAYLMQLSKHDQSIAPLTIRNNTPYLYSTSLNGGSWDTFYQNSEIYAYPRGLTPQRIKRGDIILTHHGPTTLQGIGVAITNSSDGYDNGNQAVGNKVIWIANKTISNRLYDASRLNVSVIQKQEYAEVFWRAYPHTQQLIQKIRAKQEKEEQEKEEMEIKNSEIFSFLEQEPSIVYLEGRAYIEIESVTKYERSPEARKACLEYHGCSCKICGFDFEKTYGEKGKGYIHVHHTTPISKRGGEYVVDPAKDLIPVCANCHAIIHRGRKNISIEKMKDILTQNQATTQ